LRRLIIPALLVAGAAALSLARLGDAPLFVSHDEVVYSLQAHALATTGHDLSGRFLPMYIEYGAQFGRPTWDQPMLIYLIAAALKALPFTEFTIRLPIAVCGILDVLLVFFVARALVDSDRLAAAAAVVLALTPVHFMTARTAIDFQLGLPFILGWLLCLLHYLRGGQPHLLFVAGAVLGLSLFGYVASYVLVPIFVVCTLAAMYGRGDGGSQYGWFFAGIAAPCVVVLPWMLRFPLPFRDVVAHYTVLNGSPSERSGFVDLVKDFATSPRLAGIPSLYASFWDPNFLFIGGPQRFRATQLVGVFLVCIAGPLLVGVIAAMRRHSPGDLLVLTGLFTGPLVASLGGEGQAVWRTLQLAPFAALLVVSGFREIAARDTVATRVAVIVMFAAAIGLASWYHDLLPHAQALVRAATVPLAVAGLAVLLRLQHLDQVSLRQAAFVAGGVILALHVAYFVANHATVAGGVLMAAIAFATVLPRSPASMTREPLIAIALLALVTSQFMFLYVDYGQPQRIGPIPASALLLAMRLAVSALAFAVVLAVVRAVSRSALKSNGKAHLMAWTVLLVASQVAYYGIDAATDYRLRAIHVALVVAAVVGLASLIGRSAMEPRTRLSTIAIAGFFGLVGLQFTAFAADYYTEFQARGSAEIEGNVKAPFEAVIGRSASGAVPTVYLGRIGPWAYGELYWRFYAIRHHREDLLSKTIADGDFKPERVRALAPGSLAITSPTRQIDADIDTLAAEGVVRNRQLVKAPDGAPIFWIIEIGVPAPAAAGAR
jgi:4-amino-4-deoxy-L-arabinose transferase-like glycosyltransferase